MHKKRFIAVICWMGLLTTPSAWAGSFNLDAQVKLDIPVQPLQSALLELSRQAAFQLVISSGSVPARDASPISGTMPIRQALEQLLRDTDLNYKWVGEHTVTLAPRATVGAMKAGAEEEIRLAQEEAPAAGKNTETSSHQNSDDAKLEEIVVTAQKRQERLQDVPVPVTALQSAELSSANLSRIEDYYARVPGLNFSPFVGGVPSLSIRGVTTGGFANPTVGITVNDVPFGGSTALGGGFTPPELDPSELQRVEVLRGPQGTLYGASSIGGLLKFVTVDPSLSGVSGHIGAGLNTVSNSNDIGRNLNGAINVPISSTVAIRASGYHRLDPGYIDDPVRNVEELNERESEGGRAAVLWEPYSDLRIKFGALIQDFDQKGGRGLASWTAVWRS